MERETRLGCAPVACLIVLLLWMVSAPIALRVFLGSAGLGFPWSLYAVALGGAVIALPFLACALLLRRRPGMGTVTALATALLALGGLSALDAGLRGLDLSNANVVAALRLGVLLPYVLGAAWWAPRLARLGRPPLAAVLGLDRFRPAPLALAVGALALLTLPWALTGSLGDRLTSLEIAFRTLADVLPGLLLVWGVTFTLLNGATTRTGLAGLLTILACWMTLGAGLLLALGKGARTTDAVILAALPLLLTELRARGSGIYPLLPLAWVAYAVPPLFMDPRDAIVQLVPEPAHILSYGLSAAIAIVLGLALWIGRRVALGLERGRPAPLLSRRAGAGAALALAGALLALWGLLYAAYGVPGFADDGFLIVLEEQADLAPAAAIAGRQERLEYVYRTLTATAQRTQGPLRAELDRLGVPYRPYYLVNMIRVDGHRWLMGRFADRPGVAQVILNPNVRRYPVRWSLAELALPEDNDPPVGVQANLAAIAVPEAWDLGALGEGIVVAGQDTGYDWTHPAIRSRYRGWDGRTAHHDYSWHDAWDDTAEPWDDDMHGTHTMGTILGDDGAGNRPGVAPGARWMGCRNMRRGFGNPGAYIECMEFFLAPYPHGGDPFRDGDVRYAPHLVNNSWGCPSFEGCFPDTLRRAVEVLRAAGIMMVVSAGNEGPACSTVDAPPATYDAVFSVGATDLRGDEIASFSSRGPAEGVKPDISAPGESIRSSVPGGGYALADGTSMAGPHVAGVVALVWSANPALIGRIAATEALLCQTAQPRPVERACTLGDAVPADNPFAAYSYNPICACGDAAGVPNNVYGCGLVNAGAAVRKARTFPCRWPMLWRASVLCPLPCSLSSWRPTTCSD